LLIVRPGARAVIGRVADEGDDSTGLDGY